MTGTVLEVSAEVLAKQLAATEGAPLLLDVRNPWEHDLARIEGSTLIPLNELQQRVGELPPGRTIAVYCHHGARSMMAAGFLSTQGFEALSLAGGIQAWSERIDPKVPKY